MSAWSASVSLTLIVDQGYPLLSITSTRRRLIGRRRDESTQTTACGGCARAEPGRVGIYGRGAYGRGARGTRGGAGGSDHVGASLHPGADTVRARRDARAHHALPGPVRAPRRHAEADARQGHGAEPGGVVDHVAGPPRLRVRPAPGHPIPSRIT